MLPSRSRRTISRPALREIRGRAPRLPSAPNCGRTIPRPALQSCARLRAARGGGKAEQRSRAGERKKPGRAGGEKMGIVGLLTVGGELRCKSQPETETNDQQHYPTQGTREGGTDECETKNRRLVGLRRHDPALFRAGCRLAVTAGGALEASAAIVVADPCHSPSPRHARSSQFAGLKKSERKVHGRAVGRS